MLEPGPNVNLKAEIDAEHAWTVEGHVMDAKYIMPI